MHNSHFPSSCDLFYWQPKVEFATNRCGWLAKADFLGGLGTGNKLRGIRKSRIIKQGIKFYGLGAGSL